MAMQLLADLTLLQQELGLEGLPRTTWLTNSVGNKSTVAKNPFYLPQRKLVQG
jgi:hypothetical protein